VAGRAGLLASVEVKLLRPVFAGQRLDYLVVRTHEVGSMQRFGVEAAVDGHRVAAGELTVAGPPEEGGAPA
jgi:3-hydroxymyristoyl/3-hydroxydecanoyl-(acyl carrier protein) dehydratase